MKIGFSLYFLFLSFPLLFFPFVFQTATPETGCGDFAGEFLLVYDVSVSFKEDLHKLRHLAKPLFTKLNNLFPHSKFGVASFSDKGVGLLGSSGDVCYKTVVSLTRNINDAASSFQRIRLESGGDFRESQLDALFHGAMSRDVGWSSGRKNEFGNPVKRYIILATDDRWHREGDAKKHGLVPQIWTENGPDCLKYDYPSVSLVSRALRYKSITPLILLAQNRYRRHYVRLLEELAAGGTVQHLASDSSDVISAIHEGMKKIQCATVAPYIPPKPKMIVPTTNPCGTFDKVEIVIMIDWSDNMKPFEKALQDYSEFIVDLIKAKFPKAKIAVGKFVENYDNCYYMATPMRLASEYKENIQSHIKISSQTSQFPNDHKGDQLGALYFAAFNKHFGWDKTDNGRNLKSVILITGSPYKDQERDRRPHKMAGSGGKPFENSIGSDSFGGSLCAFLSYPRSSLLSTRFPRDILPLVLYTGKQSEVSNYERLIEEKMKLKGTVEKIDLSGSNLLTSLDKGLNEISCAVPAKVKPAINKPPCGDFAGEFLLVYDISGSFNDDLHKLKHLAEPLFNNLNKSFPHSRFGVATFSDKAARPFGNVNFDICYKTVVPLTRDVNKAASSFRDITVLGGHDFPESQLDALFHGAMSRDVGWSSGDKNEFGNPVKRYIILATDNEFHKDGEGAEKIGLIPQIWTENGPDCLTYDYPSVSLISRAFRYRNITPIILLANDEFTKHYVQLLKELAVGGTVQHLASDSSDVISAIHEGMEKIKCATVAPPLPPPVPEKTTPKPIIPPVPVKTTPKPIIPPVPVKPVPGEEETKSKEETSTSTSTTKKSAAGTGVIVGAAAGGLALLGAVGAGAGAWYKQSLSASSMDAQFDEAANETEIVERDAQATVFEDDFA